MQLYDKETLKQAQRSADAEFLLKLAEMGTNKFIDNVDTEMMALEDQGVFIPLSINNEHYHNSYVCSPYDQYISYGIDELELALPSLLRPFARLGMKGFGKLLRWGKLNKTVQVNNWLLSTNLYPTLTETQVEQITEMLMSLFPDHAIVFRSINQQQENLMHILGTHGYQFIFSREVYLIDSNNNESFNERHFKKDLELLKTSGYEIVESNEFTLDDTKRITELYQALNITKHSKVNPMFNDEFVELCIEYGSLKFRGLRKNGILDAVYGAVFKESTMVTPFFGYDTSKPASLGLYRQLSALAVLEAKEKGLTLNQSAGAGSFKKRRKAKPVLEYHAVLTSHLPAWRRAPWTLLKEIGNRYMIPIAQKIEL